MDAIKGCLCFSSPEEHTYEDIDLGPTHRTYSREPSQFPSEITQDNESIDGEPLLEVGLYCQLLTAEAYAEMNNNPFHELRDVWIVHLSNHHDPLYQRVATAVDFHDVFGLIKAYLETWYLPCIIICRADPEEITGLRLLVISSTAAVNWLSTMLGNPELMMEYFRFAGIHFTSDSHSTITTPKEQHALLPPPPNMPDRMVPHTQLRILPPEAVRRTSALPDFDRDSYLADESAESVVESDSDDYLSSTQARALVHY